MSYSLLAHFYTKIKGSQEDIATYSLQYILSQSELLCNSFTQLTCNHLNVPSMQLKYNCQETGKNKERPDMSGIDEDGKEQILCEAKFYAGLTANQPVAYLNRLRNENGKGLLFICPEKRIPILWTKLMSLCSSCSINAVSEYCAKIDGVSLGIVSWDEILGNLKATASHISTESVSDIDQLYGYCKEIDDSAFIPFSSEEFGPETARRIERYYQIIDRTADKLLTDPRLNATREGTKKTAYKEGYVRYLKALGCGIHVRFDWAFWKKYQAETPFWFSIREITPKGWPVHPAFVELMKSFPNNEISDYNTDLALHVQPNAFLDDIAESMEQTIAECILKIANKK